MEFGSSVERFAGRGKHSGSRNEKPQQTSTKLSSIANRKCPISEQSKSSRLKAPSMLKTTVPKPFRFQTEERSILKASNAERSPKQVKVKDGDLIQKPEKMIRKATPTITQPFRFRTEERSFLRAAQSGQLKDKELVVQKQKRTQDEKLQEKTDDKAEIAVSNKKKEVIEDEEAKKASRAASEETDEKAEIAVSDKVYSAQIDRVDSMLQKVETDDGGGNELQMCWVPTQYFFPRPNLGLIPLGLKNPDDNRCYLNSILQVLSFTPPLAQLFLAQMHCSICPIIRGECGVCLLERHVYRAHASFGELDLPLNAKQILIYVCKFAGDFVQGRQEDAHELLVGFIGACISCLERLQPVKSPTMFDHIFGGSFLQQVKCHSCRTESNTIQPFLDISLDIIKSFSLTQSLHAYFRSELLDGANKYNCNKCCNLSLAEKRVRFLKAPNVLAIHLKRFDVLPGKKINKHIAFGETLDLSDYMSHRSQADPKPVYQLYGVVVHFSSSLNDGHYFSYIKDSAGNWYCCNDSVVSPCSLETVLEEEAYVLFFSRTKLNRNR